MKLFPDSVRVAMQATDVTVTCLPVQLNTASWETALFFRLAGPECKQDRRVLAKIQRPLPVTIETDLLELQHAAVVTLRVEIVTVPDDPLAGEILLTPGGAQAHFDGLKLLSQQQRLCWFFSDQDFHVLHSQQNPLDDEQRAGFDDLLRDAVKHDALIRAAARYDAQAALMEVVTHYELRAGIRRPTPHPGDTQT
ncbi:MAG: hypothetical protein ACE5NW_10230 [Acidiferrobacterales bacterium]